MKTENIAMQSPKQEKQSTNYETVIMQIIDMKKFQ